MAQNPCDDAEATEYVFSNVDIQVGAEFEANPINCTKLLTARKGQKYALVLLKEYYYDDITLAGYCNVPSDPGACISSVEVSLSGGASAASISSTATATSKSGGDWTEEEIAPGVSLWTRHEFKLLDVSACALTSDCELTLHFQTVRSTVRNFQGFELHVDAGWVFSLENTQWNYLPEDSTDTTNTNVPCPACPDGKKPSYFAYISAGYGTVDPAVLAAPITFELSLPNGVTGYRLGSSSNFGTQTASDPDYKFLAEGNNDFNAPTSNGQSITTNGSVNGAMVTVTSFDYGGVALLRAKAQIGGTWIYASAGARYDELGDQLPSPSCAVAGSDTRGFVQVPIDMDCNWIADSWEFEPAMQALQVPHFPKYWDQEKTGPNADSNVVPGDGYGAYDEYRGFHILEKQENSTNYIPTHKRTEATRLDSFYSAKPSQEPLGSDLQLILESRLQGIVKFHRIAPDQFEHSQQDPIRTRFFNRNTESFLNPTNFPVILTAVPSGQGYCTGTLLGLTASYQNGDLTICTDAIKALSVNDPDFEAVIRARIVAHEYGHRFHLYHYFEDRIYYPNKVTQSQAPSIVQGGGFYAEDQLSGKTLYTKLRYYQEQNGAKVQQVDSLLEASLALNNNSCPPENGNIIIGTSTANLVLLDGTGLYNCAEELSTNLLFYKSPIRVQTYRQGRIMSWSFEAPIESKLASGHAFSNASPNDISLIQVKE